MYRFLIIAFLSILLNFDNEFIEHVVDTIYLKELQLDKFYTSDNKTLLMDLKACAFMHSDQTLGRTFYNQ